MDGMFSLVYDKELVDLFINLICVTDGARNGCGGKLAEEFEFLNIYILETILWKIKCKGHSNRFKKCRFVGGS
jgi:hypothetical protein